MMGTVWVIILSSFFAGLISIDRAAFGQFQFSRPVVAAPLLGLLLGYPAEGVITGLVFELLFLSSLPIGSFIPFQALFPALLAVVMIRADGTNGILPAAIILALPSVAMDRLADIRWMRSNERAFNKAEIYVRLGRADLAEMVHRLAILRAGVYHAAAFLFSAAILVPAYSLTVRGMGGFSGILATAALVPFFTGLAALTADHNKGKGWIGFAVGMVIGVLGGLGRGIS
jgi:mannose/fructose/N-acetylgalactosamine-specific phosphotransferase system component IIC